MRGQLPIAAGPAAGWRADIDGLRAVAVLAVVAYHFFPQLLPGGFVGVDVFFVISGFLITHILAGGFEDGSFSLGQFYGRRIRRIFPALALVIAAVMLAGWACLRADEYLQLGAHAAGGAGFVGNLLLWSEVGYFDRSIEAKPLAHLWSLGVEEQFYIVWPVLLGVLWERRGMLRAVGVILLASLLAGVAMLHFDQKAAFYLPAFRFWELLAGSLLALACRRGHPRWGPAQAARASLGGLALIALGLVFIRSEGAFPGAWALLPVAGACLVIAAGPEAAGNRRILGSRVMVWIGLVSFPLYLWHWPLLAFARIVFNAEPRVEGKLVLLVLGFLLAWLTQRLLERPIRAPGHGRAKTFALATVVAGLGAFGIAVAAMEGAPARRAAAPPERLAPSTRAPFVVAGCGNPSPELEHLLPNCLRDSRGTERFALVGDSKAGALFNGLVRTSSASGRWLIAGGASHQHQALPVLSDEGLYRHYQPSARRSLATVVANPHVETVVVAAATRALFQLPREDTLEDLPSSPNYRVARDGLRRFTAELLKAGKQVVLVVDNPSLPDPPKCLLRARWVPPQPLAAWFSADTPHPGCQLPLARHLELSAPYRALLQEVRQLAPDRIAIFDTLPYLCDLGARSCNARDGAHGLYSVTDHVSDHAADRIGLALNRALAAP